MCYCFTRDIEGPCTVMHMPSTNNSRISEMAIIGQRQPLICCINFTRHLLILQDTLESFAVHQLIWFHLVERDLQQKDWTDKRLADSVTEPKETFIFCMSEL